MYQLGCLCKNGLKVRQRWMEDGYVGQLELEVNRSMDVGTLSFRVSILKKRLAGNKFEI